VRDEFRRSGDQPRIVFADIMVPHTGSAADLADVARRMVDAGVDSIGVHLQSDARHPTPALIERDILGDAARAIFERVGKTTPVQVVGGLTIPQAKSLAKAGLRGFVISGNLGQPDGVARYDLPPDQIQRSVADFIAGVSS
jgi:3-hexulose-6-phosphate synthase